tara:strand:+ start:455 stop:826 length:372 start_codon:yes stop_codon:yes gene_type:complete
MAAINKDTRLVMTILFVGCCSGLNVYFYAEYGKDLPWTHFSHAILFSLMTVGGIMGIKAFMDLVMNERMELYLLDRKIKFYWEKQQRDEQQKQRIMESMRQYKVPMYVQGSDELPPEFLEQLQ